MGRVGESYARLLQTADRMRRFKSKPADIALWPIGSFAVKPKLAIKAGQICRAVMGTPTAPFPPPSHHYYRPMFGAQGSAAALPSVTFASAAAYDASAPRELGLSRRADAEIAAVPPPERLNLAQPLFTGMMRPPR